MSTSSTQSRGVNRRINSLQNEARHSRTLSASRRRPVNSNTAYSYALRVAYLSYLLQPRARRVQSAPPVHTHVRRSSTTFHELMSDFQLIRDSKSTKFPHGFIAELEKRLTGVLVGREKRKEYQDHLVIRTFAAFLNTLKEQSFKKRMEKDRKVEDLVLIFYSNATKELSKGKDPDDDNWRLLVDRHVALFVRLITLIMNDEDWARERPELTNKLAVLEQKLLSYDQDLSQANGTGATMEAPAPLSYDVKDMPLVQVVARIFGVSLTQVQSDIDKNRSFWTEKAALKDLKTYQAHLNLKTRKTLSSEDFDNEEAYESWKKNEGPELSQMMLAIVQASPELAADHSSSDATYAELSRTLSEKSDRTSYSIDQPLDIGSLSIGDNGSDESDIYTFIPSDPRSLYRFIVAQALAYDLKEKEAEATQPEGPSMKLLSKQSTELLNEISHRWRIPSFSRIVLFLDVIREKFVDNEIDLDTLDSAFTFAKEAPQEGRKRSSFIAPVLFDRQKWTIHDILLMQQLLSSLHEALLRELYDVMMHCYETKPRPIGPVMYILENHIQMDPNYTENPKDIDRFRSYVHEGLEQKAREKYQELVEKEVPPEQEAWQTDHVIQLGQGIMKLSQRIQKRYKNNPEIIGYEPHHSTSQGLSLMRSASIL